MHRLEYTHKIEVNFIYGQFFGVEKFIKKIEKNLHKYFDDTPMQILQKYGLVRDDKITFGAYLLFVKDFCLISGVQAGRFKKRTKSTGSRTKKEDHP